MKLWQKDYELNKHIEKFTVGNDPLIDLNLVEYDCIASTAHAAMLTKIGILKKTDFNKIKRELKNIIELHKKGMFKIELKQEDVHTAVELFLTKKLGPLGKKIHTARSRNDQVLVDLRLFTKQKLLEISDILTDLATELTKYADRTKHIPVTGYTHMRKAMPSSVGLWLAAFAESLLDDFRLLESAYALNDQCPLGSAAGYGVNINIDRSYTSKLLGFRSLQNNVIYVQNSRGKIELAVLSALAQIMNDLNKLASDLCLFSMPEFGYFALPDKMTTGSSIMPQKKNPDVLELIRAKSSVMLSYVLQVSSIIQNLMTGYHRDLQLTKEPLIKGLELCESTLKIMIHILAKLEVNEEKCKKAISVELYATDIVNELVKKGVPFREAYNRIAKNINKLKAPKADIQSRKHIGAPGNLGLDSMRKKIEKAKRYIHKERDHFSSAISGLLS